ncbi:MAG: hypothetical protein ACO1OC_00090 [Tuberibacillus sp.]
MDRRWNWLDTMLFLVRTVWVFFNAVVNIIPLFPTVAGKSILGLWFLSVYLLPYLFYRPSYIKFKYYLITELILTGSLFLFLIHRLQSFQDVGTATLSFVTFPVLTAAFASQTKPLIWRTPILGLFVILIGSFLGG